LKDAQIKGIVQTHSTSPLAATGRVYQLGRKSRNNECRRALSAPPLAATALVVKAEKMVLKSTSAPIFV